MFELPERAIRCFEQWSGTSVAIHGYSDEYEFMLDLQRTKHQHHFCMSFKSTPPGSHCREIDMQELSVAIHYYRNGGIKRCHAGVLEFFMPIWNGIQLQAILFAGIRQAPENWHPAIPFLDLGTEQKNIAPAVPELLPGEEEHILEGLAQLAARLKQFFDPIRDKVISDLHDAPRDVIIRYLICRHYQDSGKTLDIISRTLSLSKSRTLHVIKEETGENFLELLNTVRVNNACFLLRSSLKPIHIISEECGFGNISTFFRVFRKRMGITPLNYRKLHFQENA